MIHLLRKLFIKDYNNINDTIVRDKHGILASFCGIVINIILVAFKIIIGALTGNMGILSDSVNNIGDASSSIVSVIGFKMAGKPADKEHPYGHERIEYIAGLIVSIIIIFMGLIMAYTSLMDIIKNVNNEYSLNLFIITISMLVVAIIFKIVQAYINYKIGKIINSLTLKATMVDSRNDIFATTFVLIGTILIYIFQINNININVSISGILGVVVSIYVVISGVKVMLEVVNPLIGTNISVDEIKEVENLVKTSKYVIAVHDTFTHSYGPTKTYMTLDAEVDAADDMIKIHDSIDEIEYKVKEKYNIRLTIHIDPIDFKDKALITAKLIVEKAIAKLDVDAKIHDFRFVHRNGAKVLSFDILTNYDNKLTKEEYENIIREDLKNNGLDYVFLFDIDHE